MISRRHRLPGYQIPLVLNSSFSCLSPFLVIKHLPSSTPFTRIGIIISSKIVKKAVDRNKLKRRLKAALSPYLNNIRPSKDILIIARHPIKNLSFSQLQKNLPALLKKSKLVLHEKNYS